MMKICPVCDRPAADLIRLEDILMCPRCTDAIDVEPALQNLDAAEWKDPARSRAGRTAVGLPAAAGRRPPRGAIAAAAVLALGVAVWAVIPSATPIEPAPARARRPVGTPRLAEIEPPAPPPERVEPETDAVRVRKILEDARPRVGRMTAVRRRGSVDAASLLDEAVKVERALREAADLEPGNREVASLQIRLYAGLGRYDRALDACARRLQGDPGHPETHLLRVKIMLTAQLMLVADASDFPSVVGALRRLLADRYGAPGGGRPGSLSMVFAHVAGGDFAEARALLDATPQEEIPARGRPELPFIRAALDYLEEPGPQGALAFLQIARDSARTALTTSEVPLWMATIRLTLKRGIRRAHGTGSLPSGSPVHGARLRWEAADLERKRDLNGALALLDRALLAQPTDVPLRLERARTLAALGEREKAIEAYEAAAGVAATMGLSDDALREISALKRA